MEKPSSDATNILPRLGLKLFIIRCIKNKNVFCDDNGVMYHNTLHLKNLKDRLDIVCKIICKIYLSLIVYFVIYNSIEKKRAINNATSNVMLQFIDIFICAIQNFYFYFCIAIK